MSAMGVTAKYLVVEDDDIVSRAIARYLSRAGLVRVARTLAEARWALEHDRSWTGFVVDVGLPDGSGLSVLEWIRAEGLEAPVLLLTGSREDHVLRAAASYRAFYAPKPIAHDELDAFVRSAQRSRDASTTLSRVVDSLADDCNLSKREREIMLLASAGMTRQAIAAELGISLATLQTYIRRAVNKSRRASWNALIDEVHCELFLSARDASWRAS